MIHYKDVYRYTKNLAVLYAEDELASRMATNDILQYFFYRVDLAFDGAEALTKYREFFEKRKRYYDIVITDLDMPKMNGVELSKAIFEKNPHQEIVIISADLKPQYLIDLINIGVNKFLLKPAYYENILELFDSLAKRCPNGKIDEVPIIKLDDEYSWVNNSSQLIYNQTPISLTKMETIFLKLLLKNGSKITTEDEIIHTIWGDHKDVSAIKNLTPLLSRLRKKLPKDIIKTYYGMGYRLSIT